MKRRGCLFQPLFRILEGLEIIQVASGGQMTLFLTSEGGILEIGKHNKSGKPFLKHEITEPIVKIEAGCYSFFALSSLGNVFSWRDNSWNQLGFSGEGKVVKSPQMISFFLRKRPES